MHSLSCSTVSSRHTTKHVIKQNQSPNEENNRFQIVLLFFYLKKKDIFEVINSLSLLLEHRGFYFPNDLQV